jgi:hypothetical protein
VHRTFHPPRLLRRIIPCILFVALFLLVPLASPICVDIFRTQHSPSSDPLFQIENGGSLAYIDQSGKILLHVYRHDIVGNLQGDFHDGLLLVTSYGRTKLLDEHGKTVVFQNVDRTGEFSEGLAPARDKATQMWGFINTQGEFIIPPSHLESEISEFSSFSDGMAMIHTSEKNGFKNGFLDRTGALAIDAQLLEANPFHEGAARAIIEGPCKRGPRPCASIGGMFVLPGYSSPTAATPPCRYAFIDKTGRPIFDQRFDDAKDFSEGLAPVKLEGHWGFIDKTGALVVKPQFDSAESFSDGLARVSQNGLSGFITHDGALAVTLQFKYAEKFVDGLAFVGDGPVGWDVSNMYWYVDHSGRRAIPDSFPLATSFFKGLAHVKLADKPGKKPADFWSGQFAYIDRIGKKVFTYEMNHR